MITIIISLIALVGCGIALWYLYQGPLYVPSLQSTVEQMVQAAEIAPGMKAVDLGSGAGRVVIAMAQAGAEAVGYEINPVLVNIARKKIKKLGLDQNAKILSSNFWKQNLGEYDVVTVFGIGHVKIGRASCRE